MLSPSHLFVYLFFSGEVDQIPMFGNPDKHSQRLFQRFVEKPGDHGLLPRHKRNVFLSSGVSLCSQETVQQAISNHLKYYQLRGETLLIIMFILLVLLL